MDGLSPGWYRWNLGACWNLGEAWWSPGTCWNLGACWNLGPGVVPGRPGPGEVPGHSGPGVVVPESGLGLLPPAPRARAVPGSGSCVETCPESGHWAELGLLLVPGLFELGEVPGRPGPGVVVTESVPRPGLGLGPKGNFLYRIPLLRLAEGKRKHNCRRNAAFKC